MLGSRAPIPEGVLLAIGFNPSDLAFSMDVVTRAVEPSLMPLELPAVTVPVLGINAG